MTDINFTGLPQEFIANPEDATAVNEHLRNIYIDGLPKKKLEIIYTHSTTNYSFQPNTDSPKERGLASILTTREERVESDATIKCIVVGLVLADDPLKYATKPKTMAESHIQIDPQQKLLRVVVPFTDRIKASSIKYYVSCRPEFGICDLKLIRREAIFFFKEIACRINTVDPIKVRRKQLGIICKDLALDVDLYRHAPQSHRQTAGGQGVIGSGPPATLLPASTIEEATRFFSAQRAAIKQQIDFVNDVRNRVMNDVDKTNIQELKSQILGVQTEIFRTLGKVAEAEDEGQDGDATMVA